MELHLLPPSEVCINRKSELTLFCDSQFHILSHPFQRIWMRMVMHLQSKPLNSLG
nr:hypothetical protein Q903MT_gene2331 [Picea sitchensis]